MTRNTTCNLVFPTLLVEDITRSVDFYTGQLGFTLRFTWGEPLSYAGIGLGNTTIHLAKGSPFIKGYSEVNFIIDDANEQYQFHRANGVEIVEPIDDREYGIRDYKVKDLDGNYLGFGHYIYNQGPKIKIEREDVPVRLEKRLAAVLRDLAEHKHMSLSATLEETLLHTFEQVGDTVASPHTISTLQYIQELKKKHGIDYDTHDGYRFEE
ncbi:VOC family protein [Chitinophaga sp. 22321]|uniref:VOC family protein n=1 Tax=Chitinophaga hostae TaxID=2831022 RepID=A0ABS5J7B2_9BACT|nr:VOC family protein [Chitinophaga hostae]MBS0030970.1 VOC family protein [Chitinophaga hostae]